MPSKKTILIVEDEEPILMALQRILELTGAYEAVAAQDGAIALDKLQTFVPDLIISDISMPEINGIELCRQVRANPVTKSVPFIFLTAKKEKMIEGLSVGGDDFLMKPFNVDEVLVKIETMFRRVSQSREQASQHKGRIEDASVEEIIELCLREKISGELILQQEGEVGVVVLEHGDIVSVSSNTLKDEEALDVLRNWKSGTFVVRPQDIQIKVDPHQSGALSDLNRAYKLAENSWWVGHMDSEEGIHQNVYLRVYKNDSKKIHALFDPGSPLYFSSVSNKISQAIGDISKINIYIPLEATPDVCLNSLFIRKANTRAVCMTSNENWQQLKHYEINPKSVKKINCTDTPSITLASGHKLIFIETPFCTTFGAYMVFDVTHKILFSGALFSSETLPGSSEQQLFATKENWDAMRLFHQKYMTSNSALLRAIERVKWLDPQPEIIAPRYGKLIKGADLSFFTERLKVLPVGTDKLFLNSFDNENVLYIQAANTLIKQAQSILPALKIEELIHQDIKLDASCRIVDNRLVALTGEGSSFYIRLTKMLMRHADPHVSTQIKTHAFKAAFSKGLTVPEF